jgi:hypothetical protein
VARRLASDSARLSRMRHASARVSNAIGYAKFYSRSHDAVVRVYDTDGNVIATHEHIGIFKEP